MNLTLAISIVALIIGECIKSYLDDKSRISCHKDDM